MTKTSELKNFTNKLEAVDFPYKADHALAPYTTWKIGGNADVFVIAKSSKDLEFLVKSAQERSIPYTIIGWGSNILISDNGIRGVVIKNASNEIQIIDSDEHTSKSEVVKPPARLQAVETEKYYNFEDLDYDETSAEDASVKVDSGVYLPYLINHLIDKGITGLQWFSGIPGTVGGAIYNNIHGGSHFFSEYVEEVTALTKEGVFKTYQANQMNFAYDYSIFHDNDDVIINAKLNLKFGDQERARNTSIAWATRKRLQPSNSAGCCFQNIDTEVQADLELESNSWGYIIDKILNLKGFKVGKAKISEKHAAFIETEPGASSSDVLSIYRKIYSEAKKKLNIVPKSEIFFLGFDEKDIEDLVIP